ncbi:ATP-binding protein [Pseudomonadota bacterium]
MTYSNLDFAEWGDAFPNKLLGASTLDRLRHGAYRLIMDGKSYRKPRPLRKPPKDQLANDSKKEK